MNFPHTILRDGEAGAGGSGMGTAAATGTGAATGTPATGTVATGAFATGAATGTAAATTATPAPEKPWFSGLYDDSGKINRAAFAKVPDDLKPFVDSVFGKYETIEQTFRGLGNAHTVASKKHLTPLAADAPDNVKAERKALLDTVLNVPKEPKGYGIARPEDFPEAHWNQEGADKMAALAHKHSISPEAARELLGLQVEMTKAELKKGQEMEAAYFREQDTAFAQGAQQAGLTADKADALAVRGAATLGIKANDPILKNASVRLACLRMTKLVGEANLIVGDSNNPGGKTYHEQAKDIINNPQNPLHKAWSDSSDPRNAEAVRTVHELYRKHGRASRGEAV